MKRIVSGMMLTLLWIGMLTLAFSTLCSFAFLYAVEASEFGNEVEFRGIAISDEKWGEIVAYGSYYCEVTVLEVLYDPNSTLSLNDNVTIAYQESLSLHIGDEVKCYGINCINCTACPKQFYGYIVCKPAPYYVVRWPLTAPKLLLETDKNVYRLGENVTITLTNISNKTIEIGGYPAWQIFAYPEEDPVYPSIFAFLAWSLDPGENDTFIWNQYNQFSGSSCSPRTYVVKDTQGWGLSAYFEVVAADRFIRDLTAWISPEFPTIYDEVNVTVSFWILEAYHFVDFGNLTQVGNMFVVDINVSMIGLDVYGPWVYSHIYHLGKLSQGSYWFSAYVYLSGTSTLLASTTKSFAVTSQVISSTIDIYPDTLNLKNKVKQITTYIELPEGYNVVNINASTLMLNSTIPAEFTPTAIGDYNSDGVPDLMIKFNRTAVSEFILSKGIMTGNVTLTITGQLSDETLFYGSYVIRVRMPGDINVDGIVDIEDIYLAAKAYGSFPEHPAWNYIADENEDDIVDIEDLFLVAINYGKTYL